jgi:LPXTG-site transpeptidase (sortase) family protein
LRISRYRITGAVMLAVGALLLTASGGYYAYAQFAKAGREDFIHEVPRPTFPDRSSSAFAGTETRPSFGQSQAIEVASVASNPNHRVSEETSSASRAATHTEAVDSQPIAADTEKLPSPKQRETVQTPIEASRVAPAPAAEESAVWSPSAEQISLITGPAGGRVGAAKEELILLQARRPGYVVEDEPEVQAVPEHIEPSQSTRRLAQVILPNQDRTPATRELMVAQLLESDYSRATPTVPGPKYATRMMVPGIGLRASVEELEVVEEGDSRAWETPKHVVGHIPTTGKPGTSGQGWYFGHLESPISGEGNIFRRLPELAARFKRGEQFTIQLDAGNERYVYQVYRTDVVHASEFVVSDSRLNDITLVSCWPQFEYSERVLVTAALVEVVEIPESERIPSSSD